jgi:putative glycosyltransferase
MKMSIVTTSYQSESTIVEFVHRMHTAARKLDIPFELIIVDDGSKDKTKEKITELLQQYSNTELIELSRNFGHHQALLLGLERANGDLVLLLDSDLEEAPELVNRFFFEINSSNADVIYGVSKKNRAGVFQNALSRIFWNLFRRYTKLEIPRGICTVRIMKRNYLNSLLRYNEVNVFLAGLWEITGFIQKPITVEKYYKGKTTYTFAKRLDLALTSLISFSGRPLRLIAAFGVLIVLLSLISLMILLVRYFVAQDPAQGWLSLITVITLFGGFQILFIGMVAIYVASILDEVKARPRAIIANILKSEGLH